MFQLCVDQNKVWRSTQFPQPVPQSAAVVKRRCGEVTGCKVEGRERDGLPCMKVLGECICQKLKESEAENADLKRAIQEKDGEIVEKERVIKGKDREIMKITKKYDRTLANLNAADMRMACALTVAQALVHNMKRAPAVR
jgi:Cu/Ag efflux protein CusF